MSLLVLTGDDVLKVSETFQTEELESLMSKVFITISDPAASTSSSPPRTTIPTERHKVLFMPSRLKDVGTSIKVVSVPTSGAGGLPASTLVIDEASGAVKAIVNARSLTALRNAAGSLLSTHLVGPTHPKTIVAFGAGKQIETHLDLHLRSYPSITQCVIVNRSYNDRLRALSDRLLSRYAKVRTTCIGRQATGLAVNDRLEEEIKQYVGNASIIICATSSTTPLFPSQWVRNGTHIILIGSYTPQMREVDRELILRACNRGSSSDTTSPLDRILLVDSKEACSVEAGELIDAGIGTDGMSEIGEFIRTGGAASNRRDIDGGEDVWSGGVTIFKSVGLGVQDVAIASAVVEKALSSSPRVGTVINDYDTT